jgi:hypothetical protein
MEPSGLPASSELIMRSKQAILDRCALIITASALLSVCACNRAPPAVDTSAASRWQSGIGKATLTWEPPRRNTDGSALRDLAGYYIYYGTSPARLDRRTFKISDPFVTTYVVDGLGPGTYYFSIVAFTANGIRSSASSIESKTIR